jgi:hypothetical protein
MEEIMALRSAEKDPGTDAVKVIWKNVDLVQENKKLRAELEGTRKQLDNVRLLLRHEKYLADKYRQIRREENSQSVKGWIRNAIDGMDEAWALRTVIGTAVMCGIALLTAWLVI